MSQLPTRRILIQKGPNGLGFSVKGGGDVGLPLIVSRVESGGNAVGFLKVGMEVSAVNGISLEGLPHYAAVEVLRRTRSPVMLFVRDETQESVTLVKNLLASGSGYKLNSNSGTLRSCHLKSDCESKLSCGGSAGGTLERSPSQQSDSNYVELYDLRTVKHFVKEILHQPKEVFAKKLAWEFPPVALGKFHKWLLSKLQKFDCEVPHNSANYIFDAFSQSLYLSRAIYDLVHLIRTLMAMERAVAPDKETDLVAVQPSSQAAPQCLASAVEKSSADLHKPQVMAAFLAELSEIRAQLAKAKEGGDSVVKTQAHIFQQNAEIKALREQLSNYEARIAALSNGNVRSKDTDLGTFFKENFKRIKNKTLKRRQSQDKDGKTITDRDSRDNLKDTCSENGLDSPSPSVKSRDSDVTISRVQILTSAPAEKTCHPNHKVADNAHFLQVQSDSPIARDRIGSSDDDYVQMNGLPSPIGSLPKTCDPLEEEDPVRPISRDYNRSSVSSSNSKSSIDSIKMKHKQTIMIGHCPEVDQTPDQRTNEYVRTSDRGTHTNNYVTTSDSAPETNEHARTESSDYMTMEKGGEVGLVKRRSEVSALKGGKEGKSLRDDGMGDYVEADMLPLGPAGGVLQDDYHAFKEDAGMGSDTISTGTLRAEVDVKEERQINATQVTELSKDVDRIMVDVQTLHRMEQRLIKPASKLGSYSARPTVLSVSSPVVSSIMTSSALGTTSLGGSAGITTSSGRSGGLTTLGGSGRMVKAHEVPIYAKVEMIASPPPAPRIRPFSFGEASNSSNTSQNELSRHQVCSKTRKSSLTSNGSSVDLKSDYSSDRPSSFNTSLTTSTGQTDRFSRVSSDVVADEDNRISVISDVKSDGVFTPKQTPVEHISKHNSLPFPRVSRGPHLQHVTQAGRTRADSEKRCRTSSSSAGLNVSFDLEENIEDCIDKEVGEDFFLRGKKGKKSSTFKKMMSFGKGKKNRTLSSDDAEEAHPGPRQPDATNTDYKRASEELPPRSSSVGSPPGHYRTRGLSGASSSSGHSSRQSARSSIFSADGNMADVSRNTTSGNSNVTSPLSSVATPQLETSVGEIRTLVGEIETRFVDIISTYSDDSKLESRKRDHRKLERQSKCESTGSIDVPAINPLEDSELEPIIGVHGPELNHTNSSSSIIYPNSADNIVSSTPLVRKTSKGGFYDELGVKINFDEIPVKSEKFVDLSNETIIDLDGEVMEDSEELKELRGLKQRVPERSVANSNLAAKVDKEFHINNECSRMVKEIDRKTSPPLDRVKQCADTRNKTPSPSFSEIDILLGDITAELDDFGF